LDTSSIDLALGVFQGTGLHTVQFLCLIDGSGCMRQLGIERSFTVDRPSARLICGGDRRMLRTKRGLILLDSSVCELMETPILILILTRWSTASGDIRRRTSIYDPLSKLSFRPHPRNI
jgi:hypothetical protein